MDRLPRHPEAVQFNKYHGEGSARYFAYDPNCPHEHDPTDHPPLFLADGVVIGTVRIGIRPEGWACSDWSSSTPNGTAGGLGGPMLEMAERYARARGAGVICLNAVSDAFRFYTRHGFRPARLRGCTRDQTAIPVKKALAPEPMRRAA